MSIIAGTNKDHPRAWSKIISMVEAINLAFQLVLEGYSMYRTESRNANID
jgi:hypothetical protein